MTDKPLKPPIFVIGGTRCGTTMLAGTILGQVPGLVCWNEPRSLWRVGRAYRGHDHADVSDAKAWVKRWIRRKFAQFQRQNGDRRIVEKTPANVLRIPFVHAVFPEATYVHIVRDGRAVLRSQIDSFTNFKSFTIGQGRTRRQIVRSLMLIPWWEWFAYGPRFVREVSRRYLFGKPVEWFGIRYVGWRRDARTLSTVQIAAKQWAMAVESGMRELAKLPCGSVTTVRYEALVADPAGQVQRVLEFGGHEASAEYYESLRKRVFTSSAARWRSELADDVLAEAMPILEPKLRELGYLPAPAQPTAAANV